MQSLVGEPRNQFGRHAVLKSLSADVSATESSAFTCDWLTKFEVHVAARY